MIERNQIYKCNVCGNIVEILYAGGSELVCCGQPMELLKEKTEDVGKEKHVPVIEKQQQELKLRLGGPRLSSNGGKALHRMDRNNCRW